VKNSAIDKDLLKRWLDKEFPYAGSTVEVRRSVWVIMAPRKLTEAEIENVTVENA